MAQTKVGALKTAAKKAGCSVLHYSRQTAKGFKWCYKCRQWKNRGADFAADASRSDGRMAICRLCRNGPGTASDKLNASWSRRKAEGYVSPLKGKPANFSRELRKKISERSKGNQYRKGKRLTKAQKAHLSTMIRKVGKRGKDHYNYKHGQAQRNHNDRRTTEYKAWREAVFERDHYTCQDCGDATGGNLRAHHLKPFSEHPELRFDVNNGITLCHTCHELRHYKRDSIRNQRKLKRGEKLYT